MTLVFKTGERIELDLDESDPIAIMNTTGVVRVDTKDGQTVYVKAEDVLYIHDGSKE